jgi:gliding motility-associated-like protein
MLTFYLPESIFVYLYRNSSFTSVCMLTKAGDFVLVWNKLHRKSRQIVLTLLFLNLLAMGLKAQVTIWSEDFNSHLDGTQNTARWTSFVTDCDDGSVKQILTESFWGVSIGRFVINDIEGAPCCSLGGANGNYWTSESIAISSYCNVSISIDVSSSGDMECDDAANPIFSCGNNTPPDNSQDQVFAEYSINGGAWTRFSTGYVCGSFSGQLTTSGLNGNTVRFRFSAANKSNEEYYYIDNIIVRGFTNSAVTITGVPSTLCVSPFPYSLLTNINGISGNWSGANVSGNQFTPLAAGSYTLTFTPTSCGLPTPWTINVVPNITLTASNNSPVCEGQSLKLSATSSLPTSFAWSGPLGFNSVEQNPEILNASAARSGTYSVTAGGCSNTATTEVNILSKPVPRPPTVPAKCHSGTGAYFNLTSFDSTVRNGNPGTIKWYRDIGATNAIAKPDSFLVLDSAFVYARIENGACNSDLVPARLLAVNKPVPVLKDTILCRGTLPNTFNLDSLRRANFTSGTWWDTNKDTLVSRIFSKLRPAGTYYFTYKETGVCDAAVKATVYLLASGPALITSLPDSICNTGLNITLSTRQNGVKGKWSGNYVSVDSIFSPPPGIFGKVPLTFNPDAGQCVTSNTDTILLLEPITIAIAGLPDSICKTDPPLILSTVQSGKTGSWSGPGVNANIFDPSALTDIQLLYFSPNAGQCAVGTSKKIYIITPVKPTLTGVPLTYCQSDSSVALPSIQSGITGTWSGRGVSNGNRFSPAGLQDTVILKFTPNSGSCADTNTLAVTVRAVRAPVLDSASLCQTDAPLLLSTLSDPAFPLGKWTGAGVDTVNRVFNPAIGAGDYLIRFTPESFCSQPAQTRIEVKAPDTLRLVSDTICQGVNRFALTNLKDPAFPLGSWLGQGVTNDTLNTTGLSGLVQLIFQPTANCVLIGTASLLIQTSPFVTDLEETCLLPTQEFNVSFVISGGDPNTYTVNGVPSGRIFISPLFTNKTNYTLNVDDTNRCGPFTVSGSVDCSCITYSGTMDFAGAPFSVCRQSLFTAKHHGNQTLEPNDTLIYVLHDGSGTSLGNILSSSYSPVFSFPSGAVYGTTYHISAVAGNKSATTGVDLSDPCLSVSQGVPLSFYEPQFTISGDSTVCINGCTQWRVTFSGEAPFSLIYDLSNGQKTVRDSVKSNSTTAILQICPQSLGFETGQIRFIPRFLQGGCLIQVDTTRQRTLDIKPVAMNTINQTLCRGDSIVVNNRVYNLSNRNGIDTLFGQSHLGCDSIVIINLSFHPQYEYFLRDTLCTGDSIVVNGKTYNQSRRNGTETLKSTTGCDSLVHVDLTFVSSIPSSIIRTICHTDSVIVNGKAYHAGNLTGFETIRNGSYLGCDSTIFVFLTVYTPTVGSYRATICPGDTVYVNGKAFHQGHSSEAILLPKANFLGCDSILNVNISFFPPATWSLNPWLCPGDSLVVNGRIYNQIRKAGTEILKGMALHGCDSVVDISLNYHPLASSVLSQTLCPGQSMVVNGNVYNQQKLAGTEVLKGRAASGCDSVVDVQLRFHPASINLLTQTLCDGDSLIVNGKVYDKRRSSGIDTLKGAGYLGCDSIISVSLSFNNKIISSFTSTLCPGDSVMVNGRVYNQARPTGIEVIRGGSYQGCDSTINVSLTFRPTATSTLKRQLCPGGFIVVNNLRYDSIRPLGTQILKNASQFGCDSIVTINLSFSNQIVNNLNATLCPGDSLRVKNTYYSALRPAGTETFQGGSYLGCDSIVNIQLAFYPRSVRNIDTTLQQGGFFRVNNVVYNQQKSSGTEIIRGGAYNGCDSIVNVQLRFAGLFQPFTTIKAPNCRGGKDGFISLDTIIGGLKPYVVALNGANSKQVSSFPYVLSGLTSGSHLLTIQDNNGVIVMVDLQLTEPPVLLLELGANQTINLGEIITLNPQTSFNVSKWAWSPPDFLSCTDCEKPKVVNLGRETTFTLVAADSNGCTVIDRITIFLNRVRAIYVPNSFSPNGDGINDYLVLFAGKEVVSINYFKVFNRWGGQLYEAKDFLPNDQNYGWDGTNRGQKMNTGFYVWLAQVEFVDGHKELFEGGVHLMR